MDVKTNNEITADLQAWFDDLCVFARYLPSVRVREQLDQIGKLMIILDVEVELPDLPGWKAIELEEPPQLVEGRNGQYDKN